jgi:hypothetical protein
MTRLNARVRLVALMATLVGLVACNGSGGTSDGGQTDGSGGAHGSGMGGLAGGASGAGGSGFTGSGGSSGTAGHAGTGGAVAGTGGAGDASAPIGCAGCDYATEYCSTTEGGAVGRPPTFSCPKLPASCGAHPTCACLTGTACVTLCSESDGGIMTTCEVP